MPGPRPKPAELEKLDGYPGKGRRKAKSAVEAMPELPEVGEPFADMSDEAKVKWVELAREWRVVLKRTDRQFLRIFCETWVEMIEALERVKRDGACQPTDKGHWRSSPWANQLKEHRTILNRMMCEVGATPSARTKVLMQDDKPASKFDGLVN